MSGGSVTAGSISLDSSVANGHAARNTPKGDTALKLPGAKQKGDLSMNRYACGVLFGLIGMTTFADVTGASDWPQWQGRDRNSISREKGLLPEWPAAGPPVAWRINGLGGGDSAPAVAGGKLFGMSNRNGKEIVW